MAEHKLVKYEYQLNSYEPYRHYAECTCGFQTRMSTKEAAQGQFNSHQIGKGVVPSFEDVMELNSKMKKSTKEGTKEEKKWDPFSASGYSSTEDKEDKTPEKKKFGPARTAA